MAVLDQVAADYASGRPSRVMLSGHADRSGTEAYNDALSEQRARNVARALVARAVPERALDVQWFGERQPRIATADGVREPQNRRVEIVFGETGPGV
jgi:OOP family OmpA-OmpF porin